MDVQLMTNYLFKLHFVGLATLFKELSLGLDSVYTLQNWGLYVCVAEMSVNKF
jgi:hypothetical protein